MDLYKILENFNQVSRVVNEAPPPERSSVSLWSHLKPADEECRLKMKDIPRPIDDPKFDPIKKQLKSPVPDENDWVPDCKNLAWVPANRKALVWWQEALEELSDYHDVEGKDPLLSPTKEESWGALARQLQLYVFNSTPGQKWWAQYPDHSWEMLVRLINEVAELYGDMYDKGQKKGAEQHPGPGGVTYWLASDDEVVDMFKGLVYIYPSPRVVWGKDEMDVSESKEISESTDVNELIELIASEAYIRMPQVFNEHGDDYIMSIIDDVANKYAGKDASIDEMLYALTEKLEDDEDLNEGAATVFSDAKGHHLKNAGGEVVQSFEGTPEGLRQARNALYANYNVLSMEKPKESAMNEFKNKFEKALNESLTINTTAGTDQPDSVNVTATDEDAHTLIAILKAAGLPYKEQEAKLVAATPCAMGEADDNLAYTPNDANSLAGSVDTMVNQLAGGLNRAKSQYRKEYPGDNPMAVNEENLMRGLWDLYKKV